MLHANAALTPAQRLKLARLIVEEGWPTAWAAKFFTVSRKTVDRWATNSTRSLAPVKVQRLGVAECCLTSGRV